MDGLGTSLVGALRQTDMGVLIAPVVRLVAEGGPVALDRLAVEAGLSVDEVEALLRGQPGTDWDEDGRLLGFGLTSRPTPHRFIVDGRVLFAFCAADTLFFPPMLGRSARVESTCPATGRTIRLEVTPDGVASADPASVVVSQASLCRDLSDIRGSVCDHGHFFASADAAAHWRGEHPDGDVRPVAEYFSVALAACRELGWLS